MILSEGSLCRSVTCEAQVSRSRPGAAAADELKLSARVGCTSSSYFVFKFRHPTRDRRTVRYLSALTRPCGGCGGVVAVFVLILQLVHCTMASIVIPPPAARGRAQRRRSRGGRGPLHCKILCNVP